MRILIVDDEPPLADSLSKGLRRKGYTADVANDGVSGLQLVEINEYDLVILDLNLPGMDGLRVLQHIRTRELRMPVLVLTARGNASDRVAGLDQGADDYLTKPFDFEELCARVRALFRRDSQVKESVLWAGDLSLDPATRIAHQGEHRLTLTRRELSTLEYLLRRRGEIVSQEELLEHVWGDEVDVMTNTVRVHIRSLRQKLGDNASFPRYIETVIGMGYRLCHSGDEGS